MSFEAKDRFLESIKGKLANTLTISEMNNVISIITDNLQDYELESKGKGYDGEDDLLQSYLNALSVEGRSEKTLERYRYIITKMLKFVDMPTLRISVYDLRKYLANEKERGISDRTLEGERQIFSGYFGWVHREGLISKNPVANIGSIKSTKKVKEVFSDVDIELMKKNCKTSRDIALLTVMLSSGCRISEITSLNKSDVDFNKLEIKVLGKGNKERIAYIDQISAMFLKKYLDERNDNLECLFASRIGKRIDNETVRKMLKGIEKVSGVKNIHPHKFRRTLATNLIKHGMPIQEVAKILGHDKIDTTMEYVVLDNNDIKHSFFKYA